MPRGKILVLNTGSSSLKYELFQTDPWQSLADGVIERIGEAHGRWTHRGTTSDGVSPSFERSIQIDSHRQALEEINRLLCQSHLLAEQQPLTAIGHRVVHGGSAFHQPTRIDPHVIEIIREQIPLAPLHNPANIVGIEAARKAHPGVPQVAVFDTAFHQTIPDYAFRYALPEDLYRQHQVRRYGFHGTSHQYVSREAAAHLQRPVDSVNLITLHLGNGASVTAIRDGRSVDTSMGMTPLEGLIMGTRCGDLDPAIVFYLVHSVGMSTEQVERMFNRESGLKGICGDNDMREILRRLGEGDPRARLAIAMFAYRVRKYIGAYFAILGRVDALVFTAGIGENSPEVRAACCEQLEHLGIAIDPARNAARRTGILEVQRDTSRTRILVIPTDEELEIARQTVGQAIA